MKTKASKPKSTLLPEGSSIINSYFEIVHLKHLFRQGWLSQGIPVDRCESVSEHTFGLAVTAMFVVDTYFPNLNSNKVLRMALIHDFGEIYAGDIIPGDQVSQEEKHNLEKEGVKKVFKNLQNGEDYFNLWEEFENGSTIEAQFVRHIDKLEMALQACVYEHQNLGDLSEFYQSAEREINISEISSILEELITSRKQIKR